MNCGYAKYNACAKQSKLLNSREKEQKYNMNTSKRSNDCRLYECLRSAKRHRTWTLEDEWQREREEIDERNKNLHQMIEFSPSVACTYINNMKLCSESVFVLCVCICSGSFIHCLFFYSFRKNESKRYQSALFFCPPACVYFIDAQFTHQFSCFDNSNWMKFRQTHKKLREKKKKGAHMHASKCTGVLARSLSIRFFVIS